MPLSLRRRGERDCFVLLVVAVMVVGKVMIDYLR